MTARIIDGKAAALLLGTRQHRIFQIVLIAHCEHVDGAIPESPHDLRVPEVE